MRSGCFAAAVLWAWGAALGAGAPLPLPEMVVSRCAAPPKIDGRIEPGEWDSAAACTAFVRAFEGSLSHIQSVAYFTYDQTFFYVAFRNLRGAQVELLQKKGRRNDDEGIVFDPSNEIWLTPPVTPATTYQTLFNAYPAALDVKFIPSVGYTARSWRAGWEIAATEERESWTVEARAPIRAFGVERVADGSTWRALFTADVFRDGCAFRAWAPGGAFADIPRHGFVHFQDNSAVFQFLDVESIFTGRPQLRMAVTAPAKGSADVTVSVRFGAAVENGADDLVLSRKVSLADGRREELTLSADLESAKLPVKKVATGGSGQQRAERECRYGICEVSARTAGGATLYRQVFPFVVDGFVRTPPEKIITTPYETAFGLEAHYAPLSKKLLVKIDRLYMPRRAEAVRGTARLVDAQGRTVAQRPIAPFREDYSEFAMDLAHVQVPVETEADWLAARPVVEENRRTAEQNKKLLSEGKPPLPLKEVPGPKPAEYRLEVALADSSGSEMGTVAIPVQLMGYQFEWLGNSIGISEKVIPPWTPMKVDGAAVSMWNRTYELDGLGLARRITSAGAPQLAGPMILEAVIDGRTVRLEAGAPQVKKAAEGVVELAGRAAGAGLEISTSTRVEFDGFVFNEMTVAPTKASVGRLSLVVRMSEAEAPCFVTTSGGWSAMHGWTPARWDSRETALGSMVGNFVPYVFLTDSERGFCWFADNDKGWLLDPQAPTIEMQRADGMVTLRVNFITRGGPIDRPATMRYGWMVTPQKPQPPRWRGYHIAQDAPYPQATCMFWNDADWAVLWPYYSSPFPRDYEKSKKMLEGAHQRGFIGCPGSIAHAIARYADYKWRFFNAVAADWGSTPGDLSNGNVARSRGPNDFQVWHYDRWVKLSGVRGLYFDETYLSEDWNWLTGGAYLLDDERVQPGYSYLGLREYFKRLRYMFHDNGVPPPNLWLHTTGGHPVYAWMPDLAMEGENVEPSGQGEDYLDVLPASRIRAIGMGRNLGCAPTIMCQAERHWQEHSSPALVHQFAGWVLLHDVLPEGVSFWPVLAAELELWQDDVRFIPYWRRPSPLRPEADDVLASAHVREGSAVLWIFNTSRQKRSATVRMDLRQLGLAGTGAVKAYDAETGEQYSLNMSGGPAEAVLAAGEIPPRMWRCVRLRIVKLPSEDATFVASFDREVAADEALGARWPRSRRIIPAVEGGRTGRAADISEPISFAARHHVSAASGRIEFHVKFAGDRGAASGTLVTIGDFRLTVGKGKISAARGNASGAAAVSTDAAWHNVVLTWSDEQAEVWWDGQKAIAMRLPGGMPVAPMGRGLDIRDGRRRIEPTWIVFGRCAGAVMDDLRMGRR